MSETPFGSISKQLCADNKSAPRGSTADYRWIIGR
jgi:hypothetical protein